MVNSQDSPKPTAPNPEGPTETILKYRRRRRWMLLVKLLVTLLVIVLGALIYLQSSHALRHIYLPMASKALGTEIKADTGSLNFTNGRLTLGNLSVKGTDGQPAIEVAQLIFQVAVLSLLSDEIPTLNEIRLINPRLTITVDEAGRSNLDFEKTAKPASDKIETPTEARKKPSKPQLLPEMRIGVIEVKNLILNYRDAQGLTMTLDPMNFYAKNIAPGTTGTFGLDLSGDVARLANNLSEKIGLTISGSLSQDETRESLNWNASMESDIKGTVPGLSAPQSLTLKADGKGNYRVTGRIEQQLTLNALTPKGQAGQIDAKVTWDEEGNQREATLEISQIGRDFLNPLIAAFAPVQIVQSDINGTVKVKGVGKSIIFETAFSGRELSFLTGDTSQPTPPLNLSFANRGSYQPDSEMATLEMITMALDEKGRNLFEMNLDHPVTLAMGTPGIMTPDADSPSAHIAFKIQTLTMDRMRPWLAIAGIEDTGAFKDGTLNGDFQLAIERMGKQLQLDGQADLVKLELDTIAAKGLTLRHEVSMRMEADSGLKINKSTMVLEQYGQTLAETTVSGRMDFANGEILIDLSLAVPKVLGLVKVFQPAAEFDNLRDGALITRQTLLMQPEKKMVSLVGKASLGGMALVNIGRDPLPLDATADYTLEIDDAAKRLRIKPIHIELAQATGLPGVLDVKGEWPTGPAGAYGLPEGEGALNLTIRNLDAAPWLHLTQALRAEALPPTLPIEADNTLALLADGTIKSSGELRVGPLDVKDAAGLPAELTFKVNHEIEKIGQQLRAMVIDLTSRTAEGNLDKVHLEGSGTLGDVTNLNLVTRVDHLQLAPYITLAQALSPEKNGAKPATTTPAKKQAPTQTAKTTGTAKTGQGGNPSLITMDLDIRKLLYQSIDVENVKGKIRLEDEVASLKVEEGTVNGGTFKADLMSESGRIEPRFSWDVTMDNVPVTPLLETFSPENSNKLTGNLSFTSRGMGEGEGEDLRRRLQSDTSFVIVEGKMNNYFLLDILARQTKVESFKNLRFFKFQGDVDVAEGEATLNDWRVNGSVHQLSMTGTVELDGKYDLEMQAGVGSQLAEKITGNPFTNQLLKTNEGYLRFPLVIAVKGEGDKYRVTPKVTVKGAVDLLEDSVGGLLESVIGRQREKRLK